MKASQISVTAARISMAAIITYQLVLMVLLFIRPDLDPYWHTISEWAIGPYGWIMSLGFMLSSLSYASLFVTLKSQVRGVDGVIGLGILLICVAGAFGVGVFTTDPLTTPQDQISTGGMIHMICGASQLMLLPFAALLISLNIAFKNPLWAPVKKIIIWSAGIPWIGYTYFMVHLIVIVMPLGENAYGPEVPLGWPPRFLFFTYMIWVVIVANQAINVNKSSAINNYITNAT